MICDACGATIPDDSECCPSCGAEIVAHTPRHAAHFKGGDGPEFKGGDGPGGADDAKGADGAKDANGASDANGGVEQGDREVHDEGVGDDAAEKNDGSGAEAPADAGTDAGTDAGAEASPPADAGASAKAQAASPADSGAQAAPTTNAGANAGADAGLDAEAAAVTGAVGESTAEGADADDVSAAELESEAGVAADDAAEVVPKQEADAPAASEAEADVTTRIANDDTTSLPVSDVTTKISENATTNVSTLGEDETDEGEVEVAGSEAEESDEVDETFEAETDEPTEDELEPAATDDDEAAGTDEADEAEVAATAEAEAADESDAGTTEQPDRVAETLVAPSLGDTAPHAVMDPNLIELPNDPRMMVTQTAPTYDEEYSSRRYDIDHSRFGHAQSGASSYVHPHIVADDGAGHLVPGEGKSRSRRRARLALVLVLLIVTVAVVLVTYGMEVWGGHTIPSVVGSEAGVARANLEDLGFTVEETQEVADSSAGRVMSVSPEEGERVPNGTTVTIVVAQPRVMPYVVGMTLEEATAALEEAGAENVQTEYVRSTEEEGHVISVDPEAGKSFSSSDQVKLTVAQAYTMPDLVGKTRTEALTTLKNIGLEAQVTYVESEDEPDLVVETSPAADERVSLGDTVTIQVSANQPTDIHHLAEYFAYQPKVVSSYLDNAGATRDAATTSDSWVALASYDLSNGALLTFTDDPFATNADELVRDAAGQATSADTEEGTSTERDVLAEGATVRGLRYAFAADELGDLVVASDRTSSDAINEEAFNALVSICGFTDETERVSRGRVTTSTAGEQGAPDETSGSEDPEDAGGSVEASATTDETAYLCAHGQMNDVDWVLIATTEDGGKAVAIAVSHDWFDYLVPEGLETYAEESWSL